jgi:hypothetical protein
VVVPQRRGAPSSRASAGPSGTTWRWASASSRWRWPSPWPGKSWARAGPRTAPGISARSPASRRALSSPCQAPHLVPREAPNRCSPACPGPLQPLHLESPPQGRPGPSPRYARMRNPCPSMRRMAPRREGD